MSTRSTTHFVDSYGTDAIIYRHSDGYPEGAGADIVTFFERLSKLDDPRFNDPSYLAAKYVVFLAEMFSVGYDWSVNPPTTTPKADRLDFLSVGVVAKDPGDIEYRYVIHTDKRDAKGWPIVRVFETHGTNYGGDKELGELTEVLATPA